MVCTLKGEYVLFDYIHVTVKINIDFLKEKSILFSKSLLN